MPRPLRPIHDGLIYHVINRGNNRQDVFHKRGDFGAGKGDITDFLPSGVRFSPFAARTINISDVPFS